jgi:SAM-dependent methyltransferase
LCRWLTAIRRITSDVSVEVEQDLTADQVHRDGPEYWKAVTSGQVKHHPTPQEDVYTKYLDRLGIESGHQVLDIGIGYGRFVPYYLSRRADVFGVDIDPDMARATEQAYGDQIKIMICEANDVGKPDGSFDSIVCWAVFDELDQTPTLLEMNRLLKIGGRALLTGKNDLYETDDTEALDAEAGARAKNHPNHFTRLGDLDWAEFGFRVAYARYFRRRGDFASDTGTPDMPERFYEYLVILERIDAPSFDPATPIGHATSRTFRDVRG